MGNKFNIGILHNNFNILRKSKHLSKRDFCKLVGVKNAFRTDYSSVGAKLLKGIQDNFPDINEEWLLTSHDVNYEFVDIQQTKRVNKIYEPQTLYSHARNTSVEKDSELLIKTAQILESNSVYRAALKSNIEAFHTAITCHEELAVANKRIDDLEEHVKTIEKRLPPVDELLKDTGQ
jgi:hypothetical protein